MKFRQNVAKFWQNQQKSAKCRQILSKFWQNFGKNEIGERCKGVYCVDLGESFHMITSKRPDDQPPQNRIKNRIKTKSKLRSELKQIKLIF